VVQNKVACYQHMQQHCLPRMLLLLLLLGCDACCY
jgi:hypothetical protein